MTLRDRLVSRMAHPHVVVAAESIEAAQGNWEAILDALDRLYSDAESDGARNYAESEI